MSEQIERTAPIRDSQPEPPLDPRSRKRRSPKPAAPDKKEPASGTETGPEVNHRIDRQA